MKLPKVCACDRNQPVLAAPELELAVRTAQRKNPDLEGVLVDEFQCP
jgi:hypothetical protein